MLDLDAIKRRNNETQEWIASFVWDKAAISLTVNNDIPALVAEVERWRDLAGRLAESIKSIETASMTDGGSVDWDSFDDVLIHSVQLADEVLGGVADG